MKRYSCSPQKSFVYHYMSRSWLTEDLSPDRDIAQAVIAANAVQTVLFHCDLAQSGSRLISSHLHKLPVSSARNKLCIQRRTPWVESSSPGSCQCAALACTSCGLRCGNALDALNSGETPLAVRIEMKVFPKHGRSRSSVASLRMRRFTVQVWHKSAENPFVWKRKAPEYAITIQGIVIRDPKIVIACPRKDPQTGKLEYARRRLAFPKRVSEFPTQ